jgi:type I restriction enzyme S subunit
MEALIANANEQKKALMQQVLSGKRRLPGFVDAWNPSLLGAVGNFRKGKGIPRADVAVDGIPCVRYGEIYTHHHDVIREFASFIGEEAARASELINYGDILFTCSGETAEEIGKCVAYLEKGEAYAGGDIIIFSSDDDDPVFLAYLLNSNPLATQKAQFGQGNSVVHISAANLAKLEFNRPPLNEQRAIGAMLFAADDEIIILKSQRSSLIQEKAALMQKLFTGKSRVRLERKEAA